MITCTFQEAYSRADDIPYLSKIKSLVPGRRRMTRDQKEWLLDNSSLLSNLQSLDFTDEKISDEFVEEFDWDDLPRLESIDFSNNQKITDKSLIAINNSHRVGTNRDSLKYGWKYGLDCSAYSQIFIDISGTSVTMKDDILCHEHIILTPKRAIPICGYRFLILNCG